MSDLEKRAGLLPTGEPRTLSLPLRLSQTERDIIEVAAKSRGMKLSTYITIVALSAACKDAMKITNENYNEIVQHIKKTVKTEM